MTDVFDFDDELDLASPPSSPEAPKKEVVKMRNKTESPPAIPKLEAEEDQDAAADAAHAVDDPPISNTDSQETTTTEGEPTATTAAGEEDPTSSPAPPTRTTCPVLKGSRHARNRQRKEQEQERQKKKQKEIATVDKHVRFANKNGKKNGSEESSPGSTTSAAAPGFRIAPRRKKRKKPGDKNSTGNGARAKSAAKPNGIKTATINSNKAAKNANSPASDPDDFLKSPPLPGAGAADFSINDDFTTKNSSSNNTTSELKLSNQIKRQLKQLEKQQSKLCPGAPSVEVVSRRRIRGAGRDVFAVQDAGNHQMIHDECAYLTSTILQFPKAKIGNKAGLIESVAELAALLSDTKARRSLWQGDAKTVLDVLDVLHHTTSALMEKHNLQSARRWRCLTERLKVVNPPPPNNGNQEALQQRQQPPPNIAEAYYTGLLLDALSAIVSFLSWDVTIESQASVNFKNSTGARSLRQTILNHEGVFPAMLFITRHNDPMVTSILEQGAGDVSLLPAGEASTVPQSIGSNNNTFSQPADVTNKDAESVASAGDPTAAGRRKRLRSNSNSNLSQSSDAESVTSAGDPAAAGRRKRMRSNDNSNNNLSQSSDNSSPADQQDSQSVSSSQQQQDPTVAGRRKRRRKKDSKLETITEDGSVAMSYNGANVASGAMTPPRSPPRVVFGNLDDAGSTKLSQEALSPASRQASPRMQQQQRRGDDNSSMVSCDSALLKIHEQLGRAHEKFANRQTNGKILHNCQAHRELPMSFGGKDRAGCGSSVLLKALRRLLTGKDDGDKHSCLDDDGAAENNPRTIHPDDEDSFRDDDSASNGSPQRRGRPTAPEDDEALNNNPLMQTNRLLGSSGAIAPLAEAMAETLAAMVEEMEHKSTTTLCQACLQHLHDKLESLSGLVDNACLLHDSNRIELTSSSTESSELDDGNCAGGVLVASQVLFLKQWMHQRQQVNGKKPSAKTMKLLNEVGLSVLQTLASLTHDNSLAADQMAIRYQGRVPGSSSLDGDDSSWTGVQLLAQLLYQTATNSCGGLTGKVAYDTCLICINTLTNVVGDETNGEVRRLVAAMECPPQGDGNYHGKPTPFLSWFAQWVLGETKAFRDAIMSDDGGHSERLLDSQEREQLVSAGNGCILLASLMMDPPKDASDNGQEQTLAEVTNKIRESILSEMPLDNESGLPSGTKFVKKTLRAFSNFLIGNLGDLSVAVVVPVRKLMTELEKIKVEVEVVSA